MLAVIVALVFLLPAPAEPLPPDDSNVLANPGFVHFYNNEYDAALADFERQAAADPANANLYNYVAQTILYREMYRDGALESQLVSGNNPFLRRAKMEISSADRTQFNQALQRSTELARAALVRNRKDLNALHALAVADALRANYLFLVEKSWLQALHESIAARKANDQILELDPHFVDAHLLHGLSEYVVSCLPMYLRVLGAVRGFHGDKDDGIRDLQLVAQSNSMSKYDAAILLAAIYRREGRPRDGISLLKELAETFPRNHLFRFEEVQMYSDLGDKPAALRVLAQVEDLRCHGAPGYAHLLPEKIAYLKANLLFWYGDLDAAQAELKRVNAKANELDLSTGVLSFLRVGQIYDLQGNYRDAAPAYDQVIQMAPGSDAAAEAKRYLEKPYQRKKTNQQ